MVYQVLARKWRPQTFQEVVGQEHVTRTLVNAIKENRVAQAYLFSGPRGVGKTTVARIFNSNNCLFAFIHIKFFKFGNPGVIIIVWIPIQRGDESNDEKPEDQAIE